MYNIGIVGTSFIAVNFIEAINLHPNAQAKAIYSRTQESGEKFASENNIDLVYTNYDQMLNDKSIDIIYIATPNSLHYQQAVKAITAGKNVLIEKPICLHLEEITELYALAAKHQVFIMEAYVGLEFNTFKTVQNWIEQLGEIGKVDFHLDQQTRHFPDYINGKYVTVFDLKMGGGAMRDLGPYTLYPLISYFGAPLQTHYFSTKNETGADESTLCLCHYQTFTASIHNSKTFADKRPNVICGENGYIEIDHISTFGIVKLFDVKGNLLATETLNAKHRMLPELELFIDSITNNSEGPKLETLATEVLKIIDGNYQQ